MPPRVHPCICGFTCRTYPQMKKHRRRCSPWKNRTHPKAIMIARLRKARKEWAAATDRNFLPCRVCGRRSDHHQAWCPKSQSELVRRQAIERHGIDPRQFDRLLRALARRYEVGKMRVGDDD